MTTPINNLPPEGTYEAVALSECLVDDQIWYSPPGGLLPLSWLSLKDTKLFSSITLRSRVIVLRKLPPKPLVDDLYDVLHDIYAFLPVGEMKDEIIRVSERYRTEHKKE